MNRPNVLVSPGSLRVLFGRRGPTLAARERLEIRQRRGKALVVAGWGVALVGVVVYCVATFAAESDADLAAILLHGAIPAARGGLAVIGLGTLTWLVGSVVHLNAALDRGGELDGGDERHRGS